MKKIIFSTVLLLSFSSVSALDITFNNPIVSDMPVQSNTTCTASQLLWYDDSDQWSFWATYGAHHFCTQKWYDWTIWHVWDTSTADPDVCETNSTTTTTIPAWRFDTTATSNYISISCTISDSSVWCTQPNALNYNPNVTMDDWSCFYTDPSTWTWWATTVNVDFSTLDLSPIQNSWISEDVFTKLELEQYYTLKFTFYLFWSIIFIVYKLSPVRTPNLTFKSIMKT